MKPLFRTFYGDIASRVLHGTRGLKPESMDDACRPRRSRPSRDAWIETGNPIRLPIYWQSRPSRDAWIETANALVRPAVLTSRPSRDAWIETFFWSFGMAQPSCRVLHGTRGLKLVCIALMRDCERRVLHGTRGLKPSRPAEMRLFGRRVLHGTRGLKLSALGSFTQWIKSRPSRDAWIETCICSASLHEARVASFTGRVD